MSIVFSRKIKVRIFHFFAEYSINFYSTENAFEFPVKQKNLRTVSEFYTSFPKQCAI